LAKIGQNMHACVKRKSIFAQTGSQWRRICVDYSYHFEAGQLTTEIYWGWGIIPDLM